MGRSLNRVPARLAISLLVIILLSATGAWARPTTPEEAGNMVTNWLGLEARPLGAGLGQQVKQVKSFPGPEGGPAYYVVYLNPGGLVFVHGDDLVEPIVGFLPGATAYDPSPANPLGALVGRDLAGRVLQARSLEARSLESGSTSTPERRQARAQRKWAWLAGAGAGPEALEFGLPNLNDERVAPFVQSRWWQSLISEDDPRSCYNYYTPPYAAGSRHNYVSGCVATAMAQLMRYHRHPTAGVGTESFPIKVDGVPQTRALRGGDGAGGPYKWGRMVLAPADVEPTLAQRQAIGALLHDAGVAVNMNYTDNGSGTNTLKAAAAFTNTFGYGNAKTAYYSGRNFPEARRDRMVNPNLHAGYPVLFGITGPKGGHAIVCDGYGYQAGTMYHHLNMGWAGSGDAWYNLPDIDSSPGFDSVYRCVYNIYERGSGEIIAGRVMDSQGNPLNGAKVWVTHTWDTRQYRYSRTTTTDANGIYGMAKVPADSEFLVEVEMAGYTFTPQQTRTGTSTNNTITTGNVWGLDFWAD